MRHTGGRSRCSECGAWLRQARAAGGLCDPCWRRGVRLVLPPGFYDAEPLSAALADSDLGPMFAAVRAEQDWTQRRLGEVVELEEKVVSEIERGRRFVYDVRVRVSGWNRCDRA